MGKSSKQLSRQQSTSSIHATSSTSKSNMNVPPLNARKSMHKRKKLHQKTEVTIKKLYNQLRRDSKSQLNMRGHDSSGLDMSISSQNCGTSVIEIDDSAVLNNTVTANVEARVPDVSAGVTENINIAGVSLGKATDAVISGNASGVRMTEKPSRRSKMRTIVIDDVDEPSVSTSKNIYSLHHSTPIKQKPSIDDLILSVSRQLNDSNNNKTREINDSSFLTIDLTSDSGFTRSAEPAIIDLDNTIDQQDCVVTSVSQSSSMSGDSDVTVLRRPATNRSLTRQIKQGLDNLNSRDKDKILKFISEKLFNGCSSPTKIQPRAPQTAEDTYIKEVIVGRKLSRNSIGSNVYNPEKYVNTTGLRMVVIDGSNVAMAHGSHRFFSVKGLKIVIDYFLSRGHAVKAFVPKFRNKNGKSDQPQLLMQLERLGHVIFTPSREVHGRDITSYDDRYIIQCAAEFDGIIVSNDGFKDLLKENPRWTSVIQTKVLPFNWVNGMIMFPRDPLGRNGPTLEQFLKMPGQSAQRIQ